MSGRQLSRKALQTRADIIEDETGALARVMVRAEAYRLGWTEAQMDAILAGPDAELTLVRPRALLEPIVRRAVDRALAIGRRS